ncbi:MAG: hypothetical protein ABIR66_05245, partial [Saprospiraceae bacterium]
NLSPRKRASLEILADFHTSSRITPQSVYSESHLDTLGVCIFIALAKKYGDGDSIIILDDLVNSVDEQHLDRFIELLHQESIHFSQVILTTHYRPWRDRYFYNRAPGGNVHFLELRNWSKEKGIRVYQSKIALQELAQSLNESELFDRQYISSEAGRILENILDFLSLKYSCRLARKLRTDYSLRELLDSFSKGLKSLMKVEHFSREKDGNLTLFNSYELKTILDELIGLNVVRNQIGAHFNFDGSLISDKDVIEFGNLTIRFARLLICPESGAFPSRNISGSYWETKSGIIRLHPLVDP